MEAWGAASDWEGVEEHGNFKRPDLPGTSPAGRQHKRSPKVEKYPETPQDRRRSFKSPDFKRSTIASEANRNVQLALFFF